MDRACIFVSFSYKNQVELVAVVPENNDFPTFDDVVRAAKERYGIKEDVYFSNECKAALKDSDVFMNFFRKFHDHPSFLLNVHLLEDNNHLGFKAGSQELSETQGESESHAVVTAKKTKEKAQERKNRQEHAEVSADFERQTSIVKLEGQDESHGVVTVKKTKKKARENKNRRGSPEVSDDIEWQTSIVELDGHGEPHAIISARKTTNKSQGSKNRRGSPEVSDDLNSQPSIVTSDNPSEPDDCIDMMKSRVKPFDRELPLNKKATKQDIIQHVTTAGHGEIFKYYEEKGDLSVNLERKFIHDVVGLMTINHGGNYPPQSDKIEYAKLCIRIFPNYTTKTEYPYEFFYNPLTHKGRLQARLKYVQDASRKSGCTGKYMTGKKTEKDEPDAVTVKEEEEILKFLKHASIATQKLEIIEAFDRNRDHRKRDMKKILVEYKSIIRLMPELMLRDFDVYYGPKDITLAWHEMIPKIEKSFEKYHADFKKEKLNEVLSAWSPPILDFLKLHTMFAPVNTDKEKKRATLMEALKSFVMLFAPGTPPDEIFAEIEKNKGACMQLVGIGANEMAISRFYVKLDDILLLCPAGRFLNAFDFFYKMHYALNIEYPPAHRALMEFIQHYIYDMPIKKMRTSVRKIGLLMSLE